MGKRERGGSITVTVATDVARHACTAVSIELCSTFVITDFRVTLLNTPYKCFLICVLFWLITPCVWAQTSVRVDDVNKVLVNLERRAPADVRPLNDAQISSEVAGIIKAIHADVGQHVSTGDLLVELDDRDYVLNLNQAQTTLNSSERNALIILPVSGFCVTGFPLSTQIILTGGSPLSRIPLASPVTGMELRSPFIFPRG